MNILKKSVAVKILVIILGLLTIFQILLILGAPFGHFAWGGQHEVLPTNLRIGSASSIILYTLFAVIALDRAKVISVFRNKKISYVGTWVLTIYSFLGILLNLASRSLPERYVQTPVVSILFLLFLYIARSEK